MEVDSIIVSQSVLLFHLYSSPANYTDSDSPTELYRRTIDVSAEIQAFTISVFYPVRKNWSGRSNKPAAKKCAT